MVVASMADLVGAMREGVIPAEVAYGRIVEALKRGQNGVRARGRDRMAHLSAALPSPVGV